MLPAKDEEAVLDRQLDAICQGLRDAIDREVELLRRERWPIYVVHNDQVLDLQREGQSNAVQARGLTRVPNVPPKLT